MMREQKRETGYIRRELGDVRLGPLALTLAPNPSGMHPWTL
jgi:hypothetical protein